LRGKNVVKGFTAKIGRAVFIEEEKAGLVRLRLAVNAFKCIHFI
jgi:hypothetical protein